MIIIGVYGVYIVVAFAFQVWKIVVSGCTAVHVWYDYIPSFHIHSLCSVHTVQRNEKSTVCSTPYALTVDLFDKQNENDTENNRVESFRVIVMNYVQLRLVLLLNASLDSRIQRFGLAHSEWSVP